MKKLNHLEPIKVPNVACVCCGGNSLHLGLETVLYNGFGGWHIEKDGNTYYEGDFHLEVEQYKTLSDIEKDAKLSPDSDWRAILWSPLRGAEYQRQNSKWVLVNQNEGFA